MYLCIDVYKNITINSPNPTEQSSMASPLPHIPTPSQICTRTYFIQGVGQGLGSIIMRGVCREFNFRGRGLPTRFHPIPRPNQITCLQGGDNFKQTTIICCSSDPVLQRRQRRRVILANLLDYTTLSTTHILGGSTPACCWI